MFFFGARRFGRMGPLGIAYTAYRLWRRLSPAQKQALRARAAALTGEARSRFGTFGASRPHGTPAAPQPQPLPNAGSSEERAPAEEQARQEGTGQESST